MSFPLVARIWEYRFQPSERAVLQAMADHADADGGRVWPSIARIAWKTDYSERQVQRCIHGLITSGVLVIVKAASGRRPTEYRVNLDAAERKPTFNGKGDTMSPRQDVTPDKMSPIQERRGDTMSPLPNGVGVTSATQRGDMVSPESTNEPTRLNTREWEGERVPRYTNGHAPQQSRAPTLIEIPDPFPATWIPTFAKEHRMDVGWTERAAFRYVLNYSGTGTRRSIEEWTNKCQKWILEDHEKQQRPAARRA